MGPNMIKTIIWTCWLFRFCRQFTRRREYGVRRSIKCSAATISCRNRPPEKSLTAGWKTSLVRTLFVSWNS